MTWLTRRIRKDKPNSPQRLRRRPQVERLEDRVTPSAALVKDINPLPGGEPAHLTAVGSTLFFDVLDEAHGRELWKTDVTAAVTVLVKDINPGPDSTRFGEFVNVNVWLFFSASDDPHGQAR